MEAVKGDIDILVFSGNAHRKLAEDICAYLNVPIGEASVGLFPDGEVSVKVSQDVRGAEVFVIQPTCAPVNKNLMEILILIDCLKRASVERITAVIPYFGYARQDRKDEGRVPITAKLVANLITTAGADRVLTIDLHAAQIQGFFDIPVDHLYAQPVFINYFRELDLSNLVVASPDLGSIRMAWSYCKKLNAKLATVEKRRVSPEKTEVEFVIGDVEGANVLIIDDVISTAGTITQAAKILKKKGAEQVYIGATHPVLCGSAMERLQEAPVEEILVTDTIPLGDKENHRIRVLSVAPLLGEAMKRIHKHESVSSLFL
jgi:ribose-phosphate pyrophosphokinase